MGYVLGHGFLALYQGVRGPMGLCATQILGLPISAKYSVNVGGGGSVVRQDFERGALIWDERQAEPWKCYFSAVGKEVNEGRQERQALRDQLAQAIQQISALQQQLAAAHNLSTPTSEAAPTSDEIAHAVVELLAHSLMDSATSASTK